MFQDLRIGLRILGKSKAFTLIALLTLALGIGASTTVFSIVNAILLKPLPYPHSERIVFPWRLAPAGVALGYEEIPWGQESKTFQDLAAFQPDAFNLTGIDEIGIRLALGAERRDVFRTVIGQGARIAGLGIAIGLVAALAMTRLIANQLYGVQATDPLTLTAVALLMVIVALLACYVPARRAMRVDPMVALRCE